MWKSSNPHQSRHFHHDQAGNFHLQSHIKERYDKSTTSLVQSYNKSCLVVRLHRAISCGTPYEWPRFTVRIITMIGNLFRFILQRIYDVLMTSYDYHLEWSYNNLATHHPRLSYDYRTTDHDSSYDCTRLDAVIVQYNAVNADLCHGLCRIVIKCRFSCNCTIVCTVVLRSIVPLQPIHHIISNE